MFSEKETSDMTLRTDDSLSENIWGPMIPYRTKLSNDVSSSEKKIRERVTSYPFGWKVGTDTPLFNIVMSDAENAG